jgi:hypothetical protein
MSTKARFISIAALLAGAGLSLGCARGPDVEATGLGLKRVVIYRNGVGYFEREGHVDSDQVSFKVRNEKVGDFLATLAVIEKGGSSVRSASFPVAIDKHEDEDEDEDDPQDARFQVLLKPPPAKKKEKKDKLETVKLTLDGKEHDLVVGYVAETPVWRPSYRLVINQATGGAKAATTADLQAWGIVQNLSGEDWKGVTLSLVAGAPLAFQSTLEKAVIPQRPIVTDQGEVIASVPTGETSLNGELRAPSAPVEAPMLKGGGGEGQRYTLDGLMEQGKDMEESDGGDGWGAADGRKADKNERGPGRGKAAEKKASPAKPASATSATRATAPRPMQAPPPPPPPPRNPSPPRDVRALAAVAMEAGTTHYDLPFPVDVPNNSATMVLLLARPVPGESIFLFAPDGGVPGSMAHPFRVVRFTNDGKGLLERGPIAVFENGAFLGQGMVDPLPPGATATVPFALERSLAVESNSTSNEEGARIAAIEGGRLEIHRDWVTHTKYTVKNGGDAEAKALIKHARQWGTRLNNAPKGTEDNTGTGSALVPLVIGKHASAVLDVDERKETRRQIDWLDPLADDAVKAYLADPRADQAVVAQLRQAWEARGKLRTSLDERDKLSNERGQLDAQIDQINSSLRAIEKNKLADELRRTLTDRLAKASTRIDEITKRVIVLDMQVSEQSIRFRDLVSPIKMVKPLPVP